jgi:hypothetical protein
MVGNVEGFEETSLGLLYLPFGCEGEGVRELPNSRWALGNVFAIVTESVTALGDSSQRSESWQAEV